MELFDSLAINRFTNEAKETVKDSWSLFLRLFVIHTRYLCPTEYSKETGELQQIDEELKVLSERKIELEKEQEAGSHVIGKMTLHEFC